VYAAAVGLQRPEARGQVLVAPERVGAEVGVETEQLIVRRAGRVALVKMAPIVDCGPMLRLMRAANRFLARDRVLPVRLDVDARRRSSRPDAR